MHMFILSSFYTKKCIAINLDNIVVQLQILYVPDILSGINKVQVPAVTIHHKWTLKRHQHFKLDQ